MSKCEGVKYASDNLREISPWRDRHSKIGPRSSVLKDWPSDLGPQSSTLKVWPSDILPDVLQRRSIVNQGMI